ncbi:MAG: glycosyltransferase family 1 protein, partial [Leptospirales bacterium]
MIASSGIGTQVQNVLRLLMERPDVRLHLLGNPRDIFRHLPGFGGKITEFKSSIYSIGEQLFFPRPDPDEILHIPHYNAPVRYLGRSVIVLHDLIHLQSTQFARPHYRVYAYVLLWLISRFARRVVTVSDTTRREFLSRFPIAAARTSLVYNGVDHGLLRPPAEKDVKEFRKEYGLPARFLLVIGIGKRHKNVDFAVKALAREWQSGRCKVPLVLGGTGGKIPEYIRETLEREGVADRLLVVPYLKNEELPLLYAAAEVFILPSLYEGFGFPLVEAMACGTPAITSRSSCMPEIGGDAARYFDPRDADDFIKILNEVLQDRKLRETMVR